VLAALSFMATRTVTTAARPVTADLLESVSYLWEFFFPALFLFASIFPRERAFTRRLPAFMGRWWTPGFGTVVFAPHTFHFVLMMVLLVWKPEFALPRVGILHYVASLVGVAGVFLRLFLLVHQSLFSLVNLGFGLAAIGLLFDSWRRATVPRLKQQLGVIAVGLSACLACYSLATSIPQLLNLKLSPGLRSGLTIAALTLGPGSIAYAVVRHKFLDTRLLARRGILYALASAALVGLYLSVLQPLNKMLGAVPGLDARVFGPVFLVMALALFQPAIARLEELLDQVLLKDPADYRNVLRQLGRELQTTIDLEQLLSRTVRTLSEALLLKSAHVVALTPAALWPAPARARRSPTTCSRAWRRCCRASPRSRTASGSRRAQSSRPKNARSSPRRSASSCWCRCAGTTTCWARCCSATSSPRPTSARRT
jgi:hypothetical protein